MKTHTIITLLISALFFFTGCITENSNPEASLHVENNPSILAKVGSEQCEPVVEQFRAGQHIDVGNVTIWSDAEFLYVQLNTSGDWELQKTHVNVSTSIDSVPISGGGAPVNGQFTIQTSHAPRVTSFTYQFPLAEYAAEDIYIVTHAEAIRVDGNGNIVQGETAYGGNIDWPLGNRWAYYSLYSVCTIETQVFTVSGTTFFDENKNGLLEQGEQRIEGITVQLVDDTGAVIATTTTDATGAYLFENVSNGEYMVVADPEGDLSGLSSTTGGNAQPVTINNADAVMDFGYELPEISGSLFLDENKNGMLEQTEQTIEGITVQLLDNTGAVIATTTTDATGAYLFENVYNGEYMVVADPEGVLSGLSSTTGGNAQSVIINNADAVMDFGYELPKINGVVFFDITGEGVQGVDEPGISGVVVNLFDENGNLIESVVTDASGAYEFEVYPGNYTVSIESPEGLEATTALSSDIVVGYSDETVDFGLSLSLQEFCGEIANGFTIGFWKNNLSKAVAGRTKGTQVDAATLAAYVNDIAVFAIEPFEGIDMEGAIDVLGAKGSDAVLLLKKQLLGSEFNFQNEAYIAGNSTLTQMFVYYGEYMVKYSDQFSRDELLHAKDWYDAYNNSHGGAIAGPGCP